MYEILNKTCYFFSFHELIAMKLNESSLVLQSTKSYTNFTRYEQAAENQPYVTAVFNSSYVKEDSANFTLGMHL